MYIHKDKPAELPPIEKRVDCFLRELAKDGNVSRSCLVARIQPAWLYKQREQGNTLLAARWQLALQQYKDRLEAAAFQRGVEGVPEPVYYKGEVCGQVVKYSDTLLHTLLEANHEKYARKQRVELANAEGETFQITEPATVVARRLAFAMAIGLQQAGEEIEVEPKHIAALNEETEYSGVGDSPDPDDESDEDDSEEATKDDGSDLA